METLLIGTGAGEAIVTKFEVETGCPFFFFFMRILSSLITMKIPGISCHLNHFTLIQLYIKYSLSASHFHSTVVQY